MINLGYAAPYKQPPRRCAIYARYSTNLQDPTSIADQIRECREAIERMGWVVVEEFVCFDEAISGQTRVGRHGLDKLLEAAQLKTRAFDVIVIDDTSRLGRNLSLTLPMTDDLAFDGVDLYFAKQELGSWNPHFRDLFITKQRQDELFSISIAQKTKRGQRGRVDRGFIGSGRTYGYRNVPIEIPGSRGPYGRPKVEGVVMEKNLDEIAVIVRIFMDRAAGFSKHRIAHDLNRDGVPTTLDYLGTKKRRWTANNVTLVLNNEKYVGVYIFNKRKLVRNTRTGIKGLVPRPVEEWQTQYRPDLACVPLDLWIAAHKKMDLAAGKPNGRKAGGLNRTAASKTYIFSGLLVCGVCGGAVVVISSSSAASTRYGCLRHRAQGNGVCTNSLSINKLALESQLLAYIGGNLTSSEFHNRIASEFAEQLDAAIIERAKALKLSGSGSAEAERKRAELKRQIANAVDTSIAFGPSPELTDRHTKLQQQLAALQPPPATHLPQENYTAEQIHNFITTKLADLASVLSSDPELAKREMQKRITKLVLSPIRTSKGGKFYGVSGDLRLFGDSDEVMLGTSGTKSAKHYAFRTLPIETCIKTRLQKGLPLGQESPKVSDGSTDQDETMPPSCELSLQSPDPPSELVGVTPMVFAGAEAQACGS